MRIRRSVLEAIVEHARAEAPLECCGLLLGSADLIEESRAAENLQRSPVRFVVDPAAHFAAIREARRTHRTVLGAYHSHPQTAAVPSRIDLAEWHDPALLQVIVSLADDEPVLRAWRLEQGSAVAAPLTVED